MYNFKDENYPEWADDNASWAFNKNTVTQLGQIGQQLRDANYEVDSGIDLNRKVTDETPLPQYQDSINGLLIMGHNKTDKNGNQKRVIVKTDTHNSTIMVQAGFEPDGIKLWNNGIIYDEVFTKNELGKFSELWERVYNNLLTNELVMPIEDIHTIEYEMNVALTQFIEDGLKRGLVKKVIKK
ncbi:hypothetical protein CL622_07595 [archaeon]|nr:hypothetical protein [archaeon]|tara:strand:+ start:5463 stop:6011 length:549 start_codon:yes stop_codon:yes gene_type:complete